MMSEPTPLRACSRCVLDTGDDPALGLDAEGVCRHCRDYDEKERRFVFRGADGEARLQAIAATIKKAGAGRRYDCILGLSGGVDSTYLAYQARRLGLRPLALHLDNGWNTEQAVGNIENVVRRLGFDLHTYVVDWNEFRDVQLAYLRASVIDIEAVTDHAILGALHRLAQQHRIKYILSGTNVVTEAVLPLHWIFNKADHINLKAIHAAYGTVPLVTFPLFDSRLKLYCHRWLKVTTVSPLNYVPYVKKDVKQVITTELGWRDYGAKHGESIFTRFYQGYLLPRKFGVDKRKAHLSNLICSKQMTRDEALEELRRPIYDPEMLEHDRAFVLKKLGLSEAEFDQILALPVRSHTEFAVEQPLHVRYPILVPLRFVGKLLNLYAHV
jgi:N-acetyl sugar amidotransferase